MNDRFPYGFLVESMPNGDPPDDIKRAWIDVILPMSPRNLDRPEPSGGIELFSGETVELDDAINVMTEDAILVLWKAGRTEAALFWEDRLAEGVTHLGFESRCGRVVRLEVEVVEVDDSNDLEPPF